MIKLRFAKVFIAKNHDKDMLNARHKEIMRLASQYKVYVG